MWYAARGRCPSSPVAHLKLRLDLHAVTTTHYLPTYSPGTTIRYCSRACRPVLDSTSIHPTPHIHRPNTTRATDGHAATPVWTTSTVTTPHFDLLILWRRLLLLLLLLLLPHPPRTTARLCPASRMRERRVPMRRTIRARDMTRTLTQTTR